MVLLSDTELAIVTSIFSSAIILSIAIAAIIFVWAYFDVAAGHPTKLHRPQKEGELHFEFLTLAERVAVEKFVGKRRLEVLATQKEIFETPPDNSNGNSQRPKHNSPATSSTIAPGSAALASATLLSPSSVKSSPGVSSLGLSRRGLGRSDAVQEQ
ncbi:hypothetical protein HDU93_005238 [Gonapodya sp. JEL0774]|nr:hypothetical protein HDU93_005238 [Gonapodya sp. JEL0774]